MAEIIETNYLKHTTHIEDIAENNKNNNILGKVLVSKLKMMQKPELIKGYINVYPNYKHQNRTDGFGCSMLSPKSLGPIEHNMSNLPTAKNLENYHQFAKFWEFELDFLENGEFEIKSEYLQKRIDAYLDPTPYRHKYNKKELLKYGKNINVPKFSIYYDKDCNIKTYNYLECRYFYCKFYQELASKETDFKYLQDKIKNGYNLNIVGYDGYNPTNNLMEMYSDTSKPFGHEMVLYTMLVEDDTNKYPWNIYYKDNYEIYKNVI